MPILPLLMAAAPLVGKFLGGTAKGAADERGNQNTYLLNQNQQALSRYGTQQNALLSALLAQSNEASNRYGTQQSATTNALNSGSQEATSRYNTRQGATQTALGQQSAEGLARAQLGLQAPSIRAKQSILGSLMKNLQPTQISVPAGQQGHVPTIKGGLSASALDPTTRQHGDELMKAALMAQLSGSDIPSATDFKGGVLDAPAPTDFMSGVLKPPPATDYSKGVLTPPELSGYREPGKMETGMSLASLLLKLIPNLNQRPSTAPSDEAGWG